MTSTATGDTIPLPLDRGMIHGSAMAFSKSIKRDQLAPYRGCAGVAMYEDVKTGCREILHVVKSPKQMQTSTGKTKVVALEPKSATIILRG